MFFDLIVICKFVSVRVRDELFRKALDDFEKR